MLHALYSVRCTSIELYVNKSFWLKHIRASESFEELLNVILCHELVLMSFFGNLIISMSRTTCYITGWCFLSFRRIECFMNYWIGIIHLCFSTESGQKLNDSWNLFTAGSVRVWSVTLEFLFRQKTSVSKKLQLKSKVKPPLTTRTTVFARIFDNRWQERYRERKKERYKEKKKESERVSMKVQGIMCVFNDVALSPISN